MSFKGLVGSSRQWLKQNTKIQTGGHVDTLTLTWTKIEKKSTQEKRANNNNYKILNHFSCLLCAPLTRSDLTVTWGAHNKKTAQSHQKKTQCKW